MEQLISELGALLGMPSLLLSDSGACELLFDGRFGVTIAYRRQNRKCVLASMVHSHHAAPDARTLELMLRGNHLWIGTHGATLSISEDRKAWLMQELPLDGLTPQQLLNATEQHVNTLEQWINRLQTTELANAPRDPYQAMQRV